MGLLTSLSMLAFATLIITSIICRIRRRPVVGILHPHCSQGGGGEKVLWGILQYLVSNPESASLRFVIFTSRLPGETPDSIFDAVKDRFAIDLIPYKSRFSFVFLKTCKYLGPENYPFLTVLFQSFASLILAMECIYHACPKFVIDTRGNYSFAYPLFSWLCGSRVATYKHYPLISTDMVDRVRNQAVMYNNRGLVARSPALAKVKVAYYHMLSIADSMAGNAASLVMCNGTWTRDQVAFMWRLRNPPLVYPPCSIEPLADTPLHSREPVIVSVGQYRPEKNHGFQVEVLDKFFELYNSNPNKQKVKMVFIGNYRPEDAGRIAALRSSIESKPWGSQCQVLVDVSSEEKNKILTSATVGLHVMRDEHFGICVVEYMAAGLVSVAHNSAGPLLDIVVPSTGSQQVGFLADSADQYAQALYTIFTDNENTITKIRELARERCRLTFSTTAFENSLSLHLLPFLGLPSQAR